MQMNTPASSLSFIGIVDFSRGANWLYITESVTDLLGYEPRELIGRPSLELTHPDEFHKVEKLHYDTVQQDKAAALAYLRMRHKDPCRGYILCGISRTVVHNVIIGSLSIATPGAKALHGASTAQEIIVITESASSLQFKRWGSPSPIPKSPGQAIPASPSPSPSSSWSSESSQNSQCTIRRSASDSSINLSLSSDLERRHPQAQTPASPTQENSLCFDRIYYNKSFRTAFILDRFSMNCPILYCSNDLFVSTSSAIGRSFFDFVVKKEEEIVRSWINCVKGWGVNENGQPSDGGFGFGRFVLLTEGRDSGSRMPEPPTTSRNRRGSTSRGSATRLHNTNLYHASSRRTTRTLSRPPTYSPENEDSEQFTVDAIFSAHSDGVVVILRRAP